MRSRVSPVACGAAIAAIAGCNADGTQVPVADASADGLPEASAVNTDGGTDASPLAATSFLRVANWSLSAPAVDLCIAPHGTNAFERPILGADVSAALDAGFYDGGGGPLLSFPQVSAYVPVSPGAYDARLVASGSPDCSAGIVADLTSIPATANGEFATIALMGEVHAGAADAGLRLVGLQDEVSSVDPGGIALRFVHAAASVPAVIMGIGDNVSAFAPVFYGVTFGGAATPAEAIAAAPVGVGVAPIQVTDAGYEQRASQPRTAVSVHAEIGSLGHNEAVGTMLAAGGSIVTIVLLEDAAGEGDGGTPSAQLLECVDNGLVPGPLSTCFLLSPP